MTLYRKTAKSTNYYSIGVYPTLFDDFLLLHYCGVDCSKKSTKVYFDTKKEALLHSLSVISNKKRNGFELIRSFQRQ